MQQIDKYGIGRVMEMALAHLGTERPLHLSFDIDSVDPAFAPGTGTKVLCARARACECPTATEDRFQLCFGWRWVANRSV